MLSVPNFIYVSVPNFIYVSLPNFIYVSLPNFMYAPSVQEMICVEAAVAKSGPVEIATGASWVGTQVLTHSKL